jgi:hypothetical protein
MALPSLLRIALLTLICLAVLLPARGSPPAAPDTVLRLPRTGATEGSQDARVREALAGTPPGLVVRASAESPDDAELEMLAALARRAPLLAVLPDREPAVIAWAPERASAGRAAAIHFALRGRPRDTVTVRLGDLAGLLDSARITLDETGSALAAFRVVPDRAGWYEWTVTVGQEQAAAGVWVRAAAPLRVLVVAGPPDWESRFVTRALEETGATVTVAQPLGRGLSPGGQAAMLPASANALADYDAVLVLTGATALAAQLRALHDYSSQLGGGVLSAAHGRAATALGVAAISDGTAVTSAERISWSVPVEVAPLPATSVEVRLHAVRALAPTAVPVAIAPIGPVLVLSPLGRGRAGVLGINDTWRWRMQAGRVDEHRAFWRSLVDWLAGGARDTVSIRLTENQPATERRLLVEVDDAAGSVEQLTVRRPDGSEEQLRLARVGSTAAGTRASALVAATAGLHELRLPGAATSTAFAAYGGEDSPPVRAGNEWARLTLFAYRSGGAAISEQRLDGVIDGWRRASDRSTSPISRELLLFALIVSVAVAEWTVRRVRGLS